MYRWLLPLTAVLIGAAIGIGGFTFGYAEGHSYLTDDPAACANCHVMEEQYSSWMKSSHSTAAVCNDCHTPKDVIGKYSTKALNGFWHSYYFTLGGFHEPIQATSRNREIAEAACRDCHQGITGSLAHGEEVPEFTEDRRAASGSQALVCTRCHIQVGHWTR